MAAASGGSGSRGFTLSGLTGGSGLVGGALNFIRTVRELNLGEIQQQLRHSIQILVTGSDIDVTQQLSERVFGASGIRGWSVAVVSLDSRQTLEDRPQLVVLVLARGGDTSAALDRLAESLGQLGPPPPILIVRLDEPAPASSETTVFGEARVRFVHAPLGQAEGVETAVPAAAIELVPELGLALGRHFPLFRAAAAERLIRDTSMVNAQFALLSSLPSVVPIFGGALGSAADLAVLTKNQALLVYKLAGLHGRDVSNRTSLAIEIAPVIGGAFLWRGLARTLVGLLPPLIGGLPKVCIAYAGTFLVGQMARYYYDTGRKPPPELIEGFQVEGYRLASELAARLRDWRQQRREGHR